VADKSNPEPVVEAELAPFNSTLEVLDSKPRVELTPMQVGVLMAPINENRVSARQGYSYVEAWDIKATLIRVFGFGGFSSEVVESKIIDIRDDGRQGTKADGTPKTPYVMAYARVRLTIFGIGPLGEDAVYVEAAIGTNDGYTIGDVADNALKSAASDALKRCAINLGTQFGLSLYNNGSRADVIRVLLNPEQKAMLDAHRESPQQQSQQEDRESAANAAIARSLGGRPLTDEERQAAAGEESQVIADDGSSGMAQLAEEQSA
jgi:hypothetical protein